MQFREIINAKLSQESDRPLMQKDAFPVSDLLQQYLQSNGRDVVLPINYTELLHYSHFNALRNEAGKLTHWETAVYDPDVFEKINIPLLETLTILKKQPPAYTQQLELKRIDFCEFGNSVPFRILVHDQATNAAESFYIKLADASRIYGLELEQLLSPDKTNFLYHNNTLVEEHIAGIPGDMFLLEVDQPDASTAKELAKAFVQFNERCFARLLGDMRSYNFVVTSSDDDPRFHIRAIDFDQQSYEGRKNLYLPQFYKENYGFVQFVLQNLHPDEITRFQQQERAEMRHRIQRNRQQLMALLNAMSRDELSENYKVLFLKKELNEHFNTSAFSSCKSMGSLVKKQLKQLLLAEPEKSGHSDN